MPDAAPFTMPSLGADMDAGILVQWRVKPGQRVHRGEVVAEVETHKGVIEVEIFADGVVRRLLVAEGERVPVGTVLAELDPVADSEAPTAPLSPAPLSPAPAPASPPPVSSPVSPPVSPPAPPAQPAGGWVRSSPSARWLARSEGVALEGLQGTGHHGAIVRADVERAVEVRHATPPSAAPPTSGNKPPDPNAAIRQAIAAAMSRANRDIPHYYLAHDIELGRPLARLTAENAGRSPLERVLPGALFIWAVARALVRFPDLNGTWEDGRFRPGSGIHPGVAVALRGGGLVAPCIHDADRMAPEALMVALADLVARARAGRLRSSEMADATLTVTSLGDNGVEVVHGVIYPPQVALVGFGKVTERPVAIGGMLGIRPVVTVTLAGDHRASDGHRGALFLNAIDRLLQERA